ncbi:hypothetical protein ENBRE01_0455, partial [Enteropsectra breve]
RHELLQQPPNLRGNEQVSDNGDWGKVITPYEFKSSEIIRICNKISAMISHESTAQKITKDLETYAVSQNTSKVMALVFAQKPLETGLKHIQQYSSTAPDMKTACDVSRACSFWLDAVPNGKIVFVLHDLHKEGFLFYVAVALLASRIFPSKESALSEIWKIMPPEESVGFSNLLGRYLSYYEQSSLRRHGQTLPALVLNQLILSFDDSFPDSEDQGFFLKIETRSAPPFILKETYKDQYFAFFNNVDFSVEDELTVTFSTSTNRPFFKISMNAEFYQQGIFRFHCKESEVCAAEHPFSFFTVDMVLMEHSSTRMLNHTLEPSPYKDIDIIVENAKKKMNPLLKEHFIKMGYDDKLAEFLAIMEIDDCEAPQIQKYCESFELGAQNMHFENNDKAASFEESLAANDENYEMLLIEEIQDEIPENKIKTNIKRGFKYQSKTVLNKSQVKLHSGHGMHIDAISEPEGTVFSDIKVSELVVDKKLFEEWLVEGVSSQTKKCDAAAKMHHTVPEKRLFIASLALKHLEKLYGSVEGVCSIIENTPEALSHEDLKRISQCILTESEHIALVGNGTPDMQEVEVKMVQISAINEISKTLALFTFVKTVDEEFSDILKFLEKFKELQDKIVLSAGLSQIFCLMAAMVNVVQNHADAEKPQSGGFKIGSLEQILQYRRPSGKTFLDMLDEMIKINRIDAVFVIDSLLSELLPFKDVNMEEVRIQINKHIHFYKALISDNEYFQNTTRQQYKRYLGNSCKMLGSLADAYRQSRQSTIKLLNKFGETEYKQLNTIFKNLIVLLKMLKGKNTNTK